ncbi:MAG: hypothetical protein AAFR79_10060 [Pseudomonadota bacterium]
MMRLFARLTRLIAVVAMAASLSALAYAHRAIPEPLPSDVVAYLQAGGSLSDICGLAQDDGAENPAACDACRITDGAALIGLVRGVTSTPDRFTVARAFVTKEAHRPRPLDPARLTRGPPKA